MWEKEDYPTYNTAFWDLVFIHDPQNLNAF